MSYVGNWSYPTAIRFGAGRVRELPEACAALGMKRPLFVTDAGLAPLPIAQDAIGSLSEEGLGVVAFSDVSPNPTDVNLNAGIKVFNEGQHDGVVAFGGGSGLDLGKLVAFMAGQSRPVWDFEDVGDWWTRADASKIAPIVAVPTTAGTGSEVGRAGVLTNSETHVKKIIFHPKVLPSIVICDPELTVGMPPFITVGTGMDAFIHSLEAYCSPIYHPLSHGIAVEGMRLVKENLKTVFEAPDDIDARAHMMSAAAMGATAFQKGLGAIHALSHPIGAVHDTHHGMTNAVVMPYVMRNNRAAIERKIEVLAAYLSIEGGFDGFTAHFQDLADQLGVPRRLSELGVSNADTATLSQMAVDDPSAGTNPTPLTVDVAKSLYESCI